MSKFPNFSFLKRFEEVGLIQPVTELLSGSVFLLTLNVPCEIFHWYRKLT